MPTTVDFGNGIVADTVVNGIMFSFPFSAIDTQALAGAPVEGIPGIGPNAGGSHCSPPICPEIWAPGC